MRQTTMPTRIRIKRVAADLVLNPGLAFPSSGRSRDGGTFRDCFIVTDGEVMGREVQAKLDEAVR
jgi:hypothetical protein